MDGRTDGWMDGRTEKLSQKDARRDFDLALIFHQYEMAWLLRQDNRFVCFTYVTLDIKRREKNNGLFYCNDFILGIGSLKHDFILYISSAKHVTGKENGMEWNGMETNNRIPERNQNWKYQNEKKVENLKERRKKDKERKAKHSGSEQPRIGT